MAQSEYILIHPPPFPFSRESSRQFYDFFKDTLLRHLKNNNLLFLLVIYLVLIIVIHYQSVIINNMKRKPLSQTNPFLTQKHNRDAGIVTCVASSTAVETLQDIKSIKNKLTKKRYSVKLA